MYNRRRETDAPSFCRLRRGARARRAGARDGDWVGAGYAWTDDGEYPDWIGAKPGRIPELYRTILILRQAPLPPPPPSPARRPPPVAELTSELT
ncbi:MAG: hypothetical protein II839_12240 [Kiritimatiellae bacterium]|nr:hypothetical protein [Kiritimatiellia bacterium]